MLHDAIRLSNPQHLSTQLEFPLRELKDLSIYVKNHNARYCIDCGWDAGRELEADFQNLFTPHILFHRTLCITFLLLWEYQPDMNYQESTCLISLISPKSQDEAKIQQIN